MDSRPQPAVNPWVVTFSVMLATFMEVLDTTVVNVSIPHIAGNLASTSEEGTLLQYTKRRPPEPPPDSKSQTAIQQRAPTNVDAEPEEHELEEEQLVPALKTLPSCRAQDDLAKRARSESKHPSPQGAAGTEGFA